MKARLYWTIRHMNRRMHDLRFAASCWWLSHRVDFLEWRRRLDQLMPQPILVSIRTQQRSRYAVRSR
jgi:hypothetical protein